MKAAILPGVAVETASTRHPYRHRCRRPIRSSP